MNRQEVFEKVRAALLSVVESPSTITPQAHLVEDLGLDSVNMASLTIVLEDEFNEVLLLNDWIASANSPSELTVDSLVTYLMDLLSGAS